MICIPESELTGPLISPSLRAYLQEEKERERERETTITAVSNSPKTVLNFDTRQNSVIKCAKTYVASSKGSAEIEEGSKNNTLPLKFDVTDYMH